ncbi:MAG: S8 family serine peptidase [Acidobacteriota bacterium]|nr:S8 family serine peptidase [Acidobacteriota bacterium]
MLIRSLIAFVLLFSAAVTRTTSKAQTRPVVWTAGLQPVENPNQPNPTAKKTANVAVATASPTPFTPNDPRYSAAWANLMGLPQAWAKINAIEQTTGPVGPDAVVVVADGALGCDQPDMAGKCLTQYTRDFTGEAQYDQPTFHHGWSVGSIIAAGVNNGIGPASVGGLTPHIKLVSAKIINSSNQTFPSLFRQAMQYALDLKGQGVNVVAFNASFGGPGDDNIPESLRLIHLLEQQGITLVAGAAESTAPVNLDNNPSAMYPAAYAATCPNVIAVTGLTSDGQQMLFDDNWGSRTVALAAPATNVPVISPLDPINGAGSFSDTSAATPHVTAAIALMRVYKEVDPARAIQRVKRGAVPYPELTGKVGFGALNLDNAFSLTLPPTAVQLVLDGDTGNVLAFESPQMTTAPFKLAATHAFAAPDGATRVMLFAQNVILASGEGASSVVVKADGGINLPVEFAGSVPDRPWLLEMIVKLPSNLPTAANISLTVHGETSNVGVLRTQP